jgi:hypothetical protein
MGMSSSQMGTFLVIQVALGKKTSAQCTGMVSAWDLRVSQTIVRKDVFGLYPDGPSAMCLTSGWGVAYSDGVPTFALSGKLNLGISTFREAQLPGSR